MEIKKIAILGFLYLINSVLYKNGFQNLNKNESLSLINLSTFLLFIIYLFYLTKTNKFNLNFIKKLDTKQIIYIIVYCIISFGLSTLFY